MEVLELAVRKPFFVRVDGTEYAIEYPLGAVSELEEKLGHSMKSATEWLRLKPTELPLVLEAGLRRNHPDEAASIAERVGDVLETEAIETVIEGLCRSTFPRAMARFDDAIKQMRERAEKGLPQLPKA